MELRNTTASDGIQDLLTINPRALGNGNEGSRIRFASGQDAWTGDAAWVTAIRNGTTQQSMLSLAVRNAYNTNPVNILNILGDGGTSGNVGIGTTNTFGYKLAVNGTIGAKEVKVENTSAWPDFVFRTNYKLRTLGEVEQFIKTNNHLPEIPTESEVKQNGVSLGEMNAKLLQKVEELTLYMIEQNKKMDQQQKQLNELKEQNSTLAKEIQSIKK